MALACKHCNGPVLPRRQLCTTCLYAHGPRQTHAIGVLRYATLKGLLPRARECTCVDCGKPATDYDHRDYAKPLDVQPVCRGCNVRRGVAMRGAA